MELFRIAYVSVSNLRGDHFEVALELQGLIERARQHNIAHNLTGALLFSGRHFAQVIEGTEASLSKLFAAIKNDRRHSEVYTLVFEPIESRQFSGWSMALTVLRPVDSVNLSEIDAGVRAISAKEEGKQFVKLLEYLLAAKERSIDTLNAVSFATSELETAGLLGQP